MSTIKLKRTTGSTTPTGLTFGEPAYVQGLKSLYIGQTAGDPAIRIGAEVDTNTSLGTSDNKLPTQNAVKAYVDAAVAAAGANTFNQIAVSGQDGLTADAASDVLTFAAGTGIALTTNAATDTVTFTNVGVQSLAGTSNQITVSGATGAVTISLPSTVTVPGALNVTTNLTVTGNLTVNGTSTTVNSDTITVDDPVIILGTSGGVPISVSDGGKDRGIAFNYYDTAGRTGFFGYDASGNEFVFLNRATVANDVATGLSFGNVRLGGSLILQPSNISTADTITAPGAGNVHTLSSNFGGELVSAGTYPTATGYILKSNESLGSPQAPTWIDPTVVGFSVYSAGRLATARTIGLTGQVFGSASFDGTSNINISTTITNPGVTGIVAGSGISVSGQTGNVTITNTGVLSVNGATGVVTNINAATSTITNTNSSATWYPTFVGGTGNTAFFIDAVSTPLTYVPSSGTVSARAFDATFTTNQVKLDAATGTIFNTDGTNTNTVAAYGFEYNGSSPYFIFSGSQRIFLVTQGLQISDGDYDQIYGPSTWGYTFPAANGTSGQAMFTNGDGQLYWGTVSGSASGVSSVNGATGAITNVAKTNEGNTFSVLQVMNAGITTSNLFVTSGSTFTSKIESTSTSDNIDIVATTDGSGLRIAQATSGAGSRIGAIRLGRASTTTFNTFLENSAGIFTIYNGINNTGTKLFDIDTTSAEFFVPIVGPTFNSAPTSDGGYRITSNAINALTGTTYALLAADNGKVITWSNASGVTLTVPSGLPVGFNTTVIQIGAGAVGITGSGTTLNSFEGKLTTAGQHAAVSIISYSSNVFNIAGGLTG